MKKFGEGEPRPSADVPRINKFQELTRSQRVHEPTVAETQRQIRQIHAHTELDLTEITFRIGENKRTIAALQKETTSLEEEVRRQHAKRDTDIKSKKDTSRITDDHLIVVNAELARYDKLSNQITSLQDPKLHPSDRTHILGKLTSEEGYEMFLDLREVHGPDYASPDKLFPKRPDPEEAMTEDLSDLSKNEIRKKAQLGHPDGIIRAYGISFSKGVAERYLALAGYDTPQFKEKLQQYRKEVEAEKKVNAEQNGQAHTIFGQDRT